MFFNDFLFKYLIYYPVVYVRREYVPRYHFQLMRSQWFDIEQIHEIQIKKIRELISYAVANIPYYQQSIISQGVNDLEDFRKLPFLTKDILRAKNALLLTNQHFWGLTKKTTGGSTGKAVTIWKTSDAMGQELAAAWRGYSWAGIDIGDKQGRFWGVPFSSKDKFRAQLIDFACHRKRFSAFAFNEESMNSYIEALNSFKPKYLYGYVSMLTQFAEFLQRTKRKLSFPVHCVIATSEVLTSYHRQLLENVFYCPVYNEYGCGEVGTIAHQCEKGSMHINSENLIVEILDGDRPCEPGKLGEVVVTELNNKAMPLIRYRLGDYASFSNESCSCGRKLPIIKNIAGRAYDMIFNKEGKMFHGEFFMYIFEEAKRKNLGIDAFQVIQLELDRIKIRIKPDIRYSKKAEDFITSHIQRGFDPSIKLEFEMVEFISREASGKMRLIKGMEN